jgi:hypothetical protein
MSIQEVAPEQLAHLLHHYQHTLAPDFDCRTEAKSDNWERVPLDEKNRLVAAARMALLALAATERENSRSYFAKPGEAEWGC